MTGLILQFAYAYTDDNRQKLSEYKEMEPLAAQLVKLNTVEKFASYAEKNGLRRRNLMIKKSYKLLERYINSRIIYNLLDDEAWTEYLNQDDPVIKAALKVFRDGTAFPKKPANEAKGKDKRTANGYIYNKGGAQGGLYKRFRHA